MKTEFCSYSMADDKSLHCVVFFVHSSFKYNVVKFLINYWSQQTFCIRMLYCRANRLVWEWHFHSRVKLEMLFEYFEQFHRIKITAEGNVKAAASDLKRNSSASSFSDTSHSQQVTHKLVAVSSSPSLYYHITPRNDGGSTI